MRIQRTLRAFPSYIRLDPFSQPAATLRRFETTCRYFPRAGSRSALLASLALLGVPVQQMVKGLIVVFYGCPIFFSMAVAVTTHKQTGNSPVSNHPSVSCLDYGCERPHDERKGGDMHQYLRVACILYGRELLLQY